LTASLGRKTNPQPGSAVAGGHLGCGKKCRHCLGWFLLCEVYSTSQEMVASIRAGRRSGGVQSPAGRLQLALNKQTGGTENLSISNHRLRRGEYRDSFERLGSRYPFAERRSLAPKQIPEFARLRAPVKRTLEHTNRIRMIPEEPETSSPLDRFIDGWGLQAPEGRFGFLIAGLPEQSVTEPGYARLLKEIDFQGTRIGDMSTSEIADPQESRP
jgi:hypothetical protein